MAQILHATYGKDKVRVFRVVRNPDGTHDIAEYTVQLMLEGEVEAAWTHSDNKNIVATDSCKNITYLHAKQSKHVLKPELFALELATFMVTTYKHIHKSTCEVIKHKWSRIPVDGKPHKYSFVRDGNEKRFTRVTVSDAKGKDRLEASVTSGINDLLVLKSSGSSFEDYVFDKYTTLKPVDDRIFSTSVDLAYTVNVPVSVTKEGLSSFPIDFEKIYASASKATLDIFATHESASVQATLYLMCERILKENKAVGEVTYKLPNKHYFAVDMSYIGIKNTAPKDAEVFMAVDAPSGLIIATVGRKAEAKL